jgi:DNA-binding transcriptional LysR family regulator
MHLSDAGAWHVVALWEILCKLLTDASQAWNVRWDYDIFVIIVSVAEAGNLTAAAKQKLHTTQPSLSRQIRDLEEEVGAQLLTRSARGIQLTPAGRAFLENARLVLSQVEAASEAARRVAHPSKPCFTMGFLTGHELKWMPEALRILRDELPNIDVMVTSQYSPQLADGLSNGKIDAAFLRREKGSPDLAFRLLAPRHGNVLNSVNGRRRTLTSLCAELSAAFGNESSSERRCTNCRSRSRLQKVEPVSCAKTLALEAR